MWALINNLGEMGNFTSWNLENSRWNEISSNLRKNDTVSEVGISSGEIGKLRVFHFPYLKEILILERCDFPSYSNSELVETAPNFTGWNLSLRPNCEWTPKVRHLQGDLHYFLCSSFALKQLTFTLTYSSLPLCHSNGVEKMKSISWIHDQNSGNSFARLTLNKRT